MADTEYKSFMAFNPAVRAWRNSFFNRYGELPRTEGDPSYDYRKAYMAGERPQPVENDTVWHWGSTGKSEDHPTAWKQEFVQKFGVDPDHPKLIYSPEMQSFIQELLKKDAPMGLLGRP